MLFGLFTGSDADLDNWLLQKATSLCIISPWDLSLSQSRNENWVETITQDSKLIMKIINKPLIVCYSYRRVCYNYLPVFAGSSDACCCRDLPSSFRFWRMSSKSHWSCLWNQHLGLWGIALWDYLPALTIQELVMIIPHCFVVFFTFPNSPQMREQENHP